MWNFFAYSLVRTNDLAMFEMVRVSSYIQRLKRLTSFWGTGIFYNLIAASWAVIAPALSQRSTLICFILSNRPFFKPPLILFVCNCCKAATSLDMGPPSLAASCSEKFFTYSWTGSTGLLRCYDTLKSLTKIMPCIGSTLPAIFSTNCILFSSFRIFNVLLRIFVSGMG